MLSPSAPASPTEPRSNRACPPLQPSCLLLALALFALALRIAQLPPCVAADLSALAQRWPALPSSAQTALCLIYEAASLLLDALIFYHLWCQYAPLPASGGVLSDSLAVSTRQLSVAGKSVPLPFVKCFRVVSRVEPPTLPGLPARQPAVSFGVEAVTPGHAAVFGPISSLQVATGAAQALNQFVRKCRDVDNRPPAQQSLPISHCSGALHDSARGGVLLFGPASAVVSEECARRLSIVFPSPVANRLHTCWILAIITAKNLGKVLVIGSKSVAELLAINGPCGGILSYVILLLAALFDAFKVTSSPRWRLSENSIIVSQMHLGWIASRSREVPIADVSEISFAQGEAATLKGYTTESGRRYKVTLPGKDNVEIESTLSLLEMDAVRVTAALMEHMRARPPAQRPTQTCGASQALLESRRHVKYEHLAM